MLAPAQTRAAGFTAYLQLLRPHQWTKNAFCLAGVFFSDHWRNSYDVLAAIGTFACFCAASSAVYILNDILDRDRDKQHPAKRYRPIASGAIGVPVAAVIGIALAVISIAGADGLGRLVLENHPELLADAPLAGGIFVGQWLLWRYAILGCLWLYLVNNFAYSIWFKQLALVDVLSVACGFVLRLLAGVYVVGVLPTTWITLCTFFLTVFLGFAKRRSELATLAEEGSEQRPVLSKYTVQLLDYMLNNSAVMAVICYALFTSTSGKNPTLVVTVPIVFFAVMHYKRLVVLWNFGEEPDWILLKDRRIQLSVLLWIACYVVIMYGPLQLFQ
jgi:4-hydroxybenzoate polyprenyltransferase